jgi:hypothetical protein
MLTLLRSHGPAQLKDRVGTGLSEELLQAIVLGLDQGVAAEKGAAKFAAEVCGVVW